MSENSFIDFLMNIITKCLNYPISFREICIDLLIFTFFYIKLVKRDSKIEKCLKNIPGPKTLPILGNCLVFNVPGPDLIQTVRDLVSNYGSVIRLWMFNMPYVMLASAKDAEAILSSSLHINKGRDYNIMRPWLGNSLFIKEGADWSSRRKLLTPAFTYGLQKEFLQVFNEQGEIMRKVLGKECLNKGIINVYPYCFRCSLDVICDAAMGTKIGAQTKQNVKYSETVISVLDLIVKRILQPWLQPDLIWKLSPQGRQEKENLKIVHGFTENVISERKKLIANDNELSSRLNGTGKTRLAFLDLLLQASASQVGVRLTDVEIRNETDLFMVAGHDTSGVAIAWTLFLLSHHPECQEKVHEELDEIFGEDTERYVTSEDLTKMKYLEMCFKEALRLRPSIPFIFRSTSEDVTLTDGKILPAGISVVISIIDIHMDPKVYPDPEKFDPERFSPENCKGRNSYAYVPFAAGPRNCLGQVFAKSEAKVILSSVLRRFRFSPGEPMESVQILPHVTLRPKNGLHCKIMLRN